MNKFTPALLFLIGFFFNLIIGAAETQAQAGTLPDSLLYPEYRYYDEPVNPDLYLIRPGERLPVTFVGTSLPAISLKVGPDGLVVNQNLGTFDMDGLTLAEARIILAEPLKQLYNCENIHISIGAPYRVAIAVNGAVNQPGTYLGFTSQRVSEIIKQAGGVNSNGSTRLIQFSGGPGQLTVDLDRAVYGADNQTNYPLYAGVSIYVPRSSEKKVHLMGDAPRSIELLESDNIETIMTLAGGGRYNGSDQLMVLSDGWRTATASDLRDQAVFQLNKLEADSSLTIFGGVNKPGRFDYAEGISLAELIDLAGGYTTSADQNRIAIFRQLPGDEWGNESEIRIPIIARSKTDNLQNVLSPNDSVFVPVAIGFVHLVGQVRVPGYYPYQQGLAVEDYIRTAGGFAKQADTDNLILKNRVTGVSSQAAVDAVPGDGDQIRVEKRLEER